MDKESIDEVINCLSGDGTGFYYFKDRYALLLLQLALREPLTKRELKSTPLAQLLDKPVVKSVLSEHAGKALTADAFRWQVFGDPQSYDLTLSAWGSDRDRWVQTTRRGYNLVLQLNFSAEHNQRYRRLIDPNGLAPFVYFGHPVEFGKRNTLAWSRMDIDLDSGEALIEEIQSDWFRYAERARKYAEKAKRAILFHDVKMRKQDIIEYFDRELLKHSHWDEAMLAATVWFLREEMGISRIFYHSQNSGAAIKRTGFRQPPRSIYSRLPRKFCFRPSDERPAFMAGKIRTNCTKKAVSGARFSLLNLAGAPSRT